MLNVFSGNEIYSKHGGLQPPERSRFILLSKESYADNFWFFLITHCCTAVAVEVDEFVLELTQAQAMIAIISISSGWNILGKPDVYKSSDWQAKSPASECGAEVYTKSCCKSETFSTKTWHWARSLSICSSITYNTTHMQTVDKSHINGTNCANSSLNTRLLQKPQPTSIVFTNIFLPRQTTQHSVPDDLQDKQAHVCSFVLPSFRNCSLSSIHFSLLRDGHVIRPCFQAVYGKETGHTCAIIGRSWESVISQGSLLSCTE